MAFGMSYAEYWDGEADLARYYRKANELKKQVWNERAWMQGAYIYEAILDAAPVLNPMAKKPEARPYLDKPYPLTNKEQEERQRRKNEQATKNGRDFVARFAAEFNKRFENETREVVNDGS